MAIYEFEGMRPEIGNGSFVHPDAVVIGNVEIGEGCFVGANCTLRGDYGKLIIGSGTNVQDNTVIHADIDSVAEIGKNVLIGHSCIVHGPCVLKNDSVVGMMSLVSTGCTIEEGGFLAMGSVLTPGKTVPAGKVAMGSPAQIVKDVNEQLKMYNDIAVRLYKELASRCLTGLKRIDQPD